MTNITRRSFVTSVGVVSVAPTAMLASAVEIRVAKPTAGEATPDIAVADRPTYLFFNA